MDLEKLRRSPIGQLVPITGAHRGREYSHFAFLPDELPNEVAISPAAWRSLTDAVYALGRLDGAGRRLPNPGLLTRPAIREEAVSTSAIEGTYTTLPSLFESELLQSEERPDQDIQEVLSYVRTAELGFHVIRERGLTLSLIKELHAVLVESDPDVPDDEKGEFRQRQNFIGARDARVEDARFVPPPPGDQLLSGLEAWERWIHRPDVPFLVRVALGHYQFETLHPFIDGNGRLGRLIAVLMLLEDGALTVPLLNLSPYFERHRDQYEGLLRDVSATGDFDPWTQFFLLAVGTQAQSALSQTEALISLKDETVNMLRSKKVRGIAMQLAEDLIGLPVVTPRLVATKYMVTYQAAAYAIDRLVREQVLTPISRNRRKLYMAGDVMRILS
jgi:Fic family protein